MEQILASKLLAGLAPESMQIPQGQMISRVTTDSRRVRPGSVFVAFAGERYDGHDFAAAALQAGASYVVLSHPVAGVDEAKTILCPDGYQAMMRLGANYRAQYSPVVVGITGSVGKTTTKEFCYAALNAFGNTIKTEGNQNNELGLPRTLLRMDKKTEYAAVEMGMSHAGEISRLSRAARPSAGIITCIGTAHIENLGTREDICRAKLEICDGLEYGAPLVLNFDDPYLRAAQLPDHVRPVWFSLQSPKADVVAADIHQPAGGGTSFVLNDLENGMFAVHIPAMGSHIVADALAAYTAVTRLGLDARTAVRALEDFEQTGMRQRVVDSCGVTVIEDCYNANPDSMAAALQMFSKYPARRRIALLADMLELGKISREEHEKVGRLVAQANIDVLITYGDMARRIAVTAAAKGVRSIHANNHGEAAEALQACARPGDAVLVKGSRGMKLEKALEIFYAGQQVGGAQ